MMAIVPISINEAAIISLALYYLLFCYLKPLFVRKLTLTHIEYFLSFSTPQRRLSLIINCNWWPHILKYDVISTWHFNYYLI